MNKTKIIILTVLLAITLPFIFSEKLLSWISPRDSNKANIFETIGKNIAGIRKQETPLISITADVPKNEEGLKPIEKPYRVLIMGDSLVAVAGGFGDILEQKLITLEDITVLRKGKVSSGMSRPDYFDWQKESKDLIESFKPNIAIVMMGTNDAQAFEIVENNVKKVLNYGTPEWDKEYTNRLKAFNKQLTDNNVRVYFIGLPAMRDEAYGNKIKHINELNQEAKKDNNQVIFISSEKLLEGYKAFMPDENGVMRATRLEDGIHLTYFGGNLLVDKIIEEIDILQ